MSSYMLTIFYSSRRWCTRCELQRILDACERELTWFDMVINTNKSCYIRIGPRNDYVCANITTSQGYRLTWTNEIRYLGTTLYIHCKEPTI